MSRLLLYKLLLLIVIWANFHHLLKAQFVTIHENSSDSIELVHWLQSLEKQYAINFSYNRSLFKDLLLPKKSELNNLKKSIDYASNLLPIRFEENGTNSYLIIPIRKSAQFEVSDGVTGEFVFSVKIKLNNLEETYLLPKETYYEIPNLFPTDSIRISSRFYAPKSFLASNLFELNKPLTLEPDTVYLNEVVVEDYLAPGIDSKLSDHSIQVNMKNLGLLAGETDGDILQILKTTPGIRTPDGKPGSINFRGSTFDQTLIYFDEIPIYHTGHFFGTISPYNTAIIDKVEIHRGVLPAKWGGRVGGMINLQSENKVADSTNYGFMINTVYAGIKLKTPVIKNKLGVSISARSNYPIDHLAPKLQKFSDLNFQGSKIDPFVLSGQKDKVLDQFDVRFRDINSKVIYHFNDNHKATFSFMNIINHFTYNFNSSDRGLIEIQNSDLNNWGMTLKWEGRISEKIKFSVSSAKSSLTIFEKNTETESGILQRSETITNGINDLRVNTNLNYKISNHSNIDIGYKLTSLKVEFDESNAISLSEKMQSDHAKVHSFHVSSEHNWGTRLITNIGIHSDYYSELDRQYLDPRFSASLKVTDFFYLKASGGRSHQFIKQQLKDDFNDFRVQNQFWSLADDQRPVLEGYQGMFGILYDRFNWLIDIELYTKKTNGLSTVAADNGTLLTRGTDIFIKRRWKNFESWLSYTLSHIQTDFDVTTTAYFDQTHIFSFTWLHHLARWNYALSWRYTSGMPVVLPELDPTHNNSNGQTSLSIPYDPNFPAQHQLDLSVTYKFWQVANQWRGVIGLSFLNLYNQENFINVYQNNPRVEDPFRRAVGFAPNINISLNF